MVESRAGCPMRSAFLSFVAILLVLPGLAQMRSTISAGPLRGGRPHPPGVIFRSGFGHHFRANHFGPVVYPFGIYDGFYGDGYDQAYPEVVEQPAPPVIVVRDERPATVAPVQIAPAEPPKMIDVPEAVTARPAASTRTPSAIFIFSDGRKIEAQNYTITDSLLTFKEPYRAAVQVPLSQLNVDATLAENQQRGLNLQIPENKSEILLGF